jgi:hypothetical protein
MYVFNNISLNYSYNEKCFRKSCRENQNTQFALDIFVENSAVYEIMWGKNILEPERLQMTTWRMRIACWIRKATNTHSEYVIRLAFPLQQWLHERV